MKLVKYFIVALLILSALVFSACNGDGEVTVDNTSESQGITEQTEAQDVVIAIDGKPVYSLI